MDLNLLKIFNKVAEQGSLTKAAAQLNHPKSKLSRDLDKLEDELQMTLLIRTPRGITLTQDGINLLKYTQEHLEALDFSIRHMKSESREMKGLIKLTAPEDLSTTLLPPLIFNFLKKYPEIQIELYSTNTFLDFQKYGIDLALRIGKLPDSSLIQKKISEVKLIFVASARYFQVHQVPENFNELNRHSVALLKDLYGNYLNTKMFDQIKLQFSTNSIPVLKSFVNSDSGIATLPNFMCKSEIINKEFIQVTPEITYTDRALFILSQKTSFIPKHVKIFKNYVFDHLKRELELTLL